MVTRGPGVRAGLTRSAVVAAAVRLIDDEGVAALSMRRVAATLGVAPNALYSHVEGKGGLVDLVLDEALAAVSDRGSADAQAGDVATTAEDDEADPDPRTTVRTVMTRTYDVLVARPGLVPLYLARQGSRGPHARALGEVLDAALVRLGLPADRATDVRRVLIVQTIGFAAFATDGDGPLTAAAVRRNFELGLDLLLAGI